MMSFKSKFLLNIVLFCLNLHLCYADKTKNNNVNNCMKDIQEHISIPPVYNKEYIGKMFFELTIYDIRTYYARLYFLDVLDKTEIDSKIISPFEFCDKKFQKGTLVATITRTEKKLKDCNNTMKLYGFYPTINLRIHFEHLFLHYKINQFKNDKILKDYMNTVFQSVHDINLIQGPGNFCESKLNKIIDICKSNDASDIMKDFNGNYKELKCSDIAFRIKNKNKMKTKYGKLFYIQIRDKIKGVVGGFQKLQQFCDGKSIECKNELAEAGYKENFDYLSILLHTYYNVVLDNSKPFLTFLMNEILKNYNLKKIPNDCCNTLDGFCTEMVMHSLSLEVVAI